MVYLSPDDEQFMQRQEVLWRCKRKWSGLPEAAVASPIRYRHRPRQVCAIRRWLPRWRLFR